MKRYIRAAISLIYSFIKFCFIKLFHFRGFKFKALSLFSPFTEIELGRKSKLKLGKLVKAKSGTKIKVRDKGNVEVGDNTSFNHGCIIVSYDKISIGRDVQFGPNALVYDHDHDFRAKDSDNCVVGAGSVISGKFENNTIVVQKKETIMTGYSWSGDNQ